jgi:soluble lytic murein transglycosylase
MRKRIIILLIIVLFGMAVGFSAWYYWTHRYDKLIVEIAAQYNLDPELVKAIIYEESFFNPRAHSSQNAVGLMQVTPIAAQEWMEAKRSRSLGEAVATLSNGSTAARGEMSFEEALSDPFVSLHVGCWYLQNLLERYANEPHPLAVSLAAYNAGPTNVERWASSSDRLNLSREEFIARIQFPVTRDYVESILERYDYYKRDRDIKQ